MAAARADAEAVQTITISYSLAVNVLPCIRGSRAVAARHDITVGSDPAEQAAALFDLAVELRDRLRFRSAQVGPFFKGAGVRADDGGTGPASPVHASWHVALFSALFKRAGPLWCQTSFNPC